MQSYSFSQLWMNSNMLVSHSPPAYDLTVWEGEQNIDESRETDGLYLYLCMRLQAASVPRSHYWLQKPSAASRLPFTCQQWAEPVNMVEKCFSKSGWHKSLSVFVCPSAQSHGNRGDGLQREQSPNKTVLSVLMIRICIVGPLDPQHVSQCKTTLCHISTMK